MKKQRRFVDWASQVLVSPVAVLLGAALMGSNCSDWQCHVKATTLLITSLIAVAITYPITLVIAAINRHRDEEQRG